MGRELNMDTQRQNFWKEAIKKEAYVRLAWHEKYSAEFGRNSGEEKRLNRTKRMTDMVPKPPTRSLTLPVISYPKKKQTLSAIQTAPTRVSQDPNALLVEMQPVTPGSISLSAFTIAVYNIVIAKKSD